MLIVFDLPAQNLAPNFSFENYSSCPTGLGQLYLLGDWYNPANGSPDYFNACWNGGSQGVDVPLNFAGYQAVLTGDGYAGIATHSPNLFREYIQAELLEPLDSGQCYYIEMFVSPAFNNNSVCYAVSHLGIYLSSSPPPVEPNGFHIYTTPQLYYNYVVNDTIGWTRLSGTYIAEGGEQYITIGNFFQSGSYQIEVLDPGCPQLTGAYYYIENVKVQPILNDELNLEAEICEENCYTYLGIQYCNEGIYEIPVNEDCYSTVNLTISFGGQSATAVIEEPDLLDCDVLSILLDASGSSSGGGVLYQWSGPNSFDSNEQNPEVFAPGVYTLTVSGGGLCSAEASIEVLEELIPPNISAQAEGIIDCHNIPATLTGSSNNPNVTYNWSGPGLNVNTPTATTGQAGTYTFTVTTVAGCTNIQTVIVESDVETPDITAQVDGIIDCNNPVVTLNGSSNTPGVSYHWTGPGLDANTQSATADQSGNFTLTVTAPNGCTSIEAIFVLDDLEPPDIFAQVIGSLDCNNASVTLTGSSNTQDVSYYWSGPGVDTNEPLTSANQLGVYTFSVTGPNGCVSSQEVFVAENVEAPDISAQVVGTLDCNTSTVTLSGSSQTLGATFHWTGPDVDSNNPVALADQPGDFTLTVTGPNGCTSSTVVNVEDGADPPDITAEVEGALDCNNILVTLSGNSETPGVSFHWLGPNIDTTLAEFETAEPGIYTLTVTAPNGCTSSEEVEVIQENTALEIETTVSGILDCENDTINLSGNANTPNAVYQWSGPGGTQNEPEIQVDQPGEYTLLVSNGSGCTADTTILVEQNIDTPLALIGSPDTLTCNTLSVDLDASGSGNNVAFEWQDEANETLGNDSILTASEAGTYTLILTDPANGCSSETTVEVLENTAEPTAAAEADGALDCDGNPVTLDGSGSSGVMLQFLWLDIENDSISTDTFAEVLTAGIYTLIVTDAQNGCSASAEIEVESNAEFPAAIAQAGDILDCNNMESTLDGSGSEEGINIFYQWQNPSGDSISNTLQTTATAPGIYTLIVFNDENGCSASVQVEVFQDTAPPQANAGQDQLITCDEPLATLDGSGSNGSGNLLFQWTNSENEIVSDSATLETDEPGIYTLTVIAENGCTASDSAEITLGNNIPIADPGAGGTLDCAVNLLTLGGSETSSGATIIYQWLDGNNTEIATTATTEVTSPGIYTLVVTNTENNCTVAAEIEIFQNIETPLADAGASSVLNCLQTEITLDGSQSSSGQGFEYQWFDSNDSLISTEISTPVSLPGTYTLIVLNTENNCMAESEVVISQNLDTPVADAGNDGVLSCDVSEITLDGSASSGNNLSFEWFNENQILVGNEATIQVSQPGIYTLIVTNTESQCSALASATVIPDENLPTAIASADGILTCEISELTLDGSASLSVSGNTGFEWLDGSGSTISNTENATATASGIYTLIVTDNENGCSVSTTLQVAQDIQPPIAEAGENQTLNCGETELSLDGSTSSGQNLAFEWSDEDGNFISNLATATVFSSGTFFLFVTNTENGCSATDSLEIIPDQNLPIADAGIAETLTCSLTETMLDGSGSDTGLQFSYEWYDENDVLVGTDLQLVVSLPGTYTLVVLNTENNCQAQDEIVVLQNTQTPLTDAGDNQTLTCTQTIVTLTGTGSGGNDLSFEWFDENQLFIANSAQTSVSIPGIYTLLVTDEENGCTATADATVAIDTLAPIAVIGNPYELTCVVETVLLNGSGSSVGLQFSYQWQDANAAIIGTEIQLSVSLPGNYTFLVFNAENGCESQAGIEVFENTIPPTAVASTDEEFDCVTESVALDGNGSSVGSAFTYLWTGNGTIDDPTSLEPTVYEPGVFTIIVTNLENGCTDSASVLVSEDENMPTDAEIEAVDPPCYGDSGSIAILSVTGGEPGYLYSIDGGGNFSTSGIFIGLSPGIYEILIQDAKGCELEDIVEIEAALLQNIFLEPEVEVELGDDYRIEVQTNIPPMEIDTIIWSPTEGLSCADCLEPTVLSILGETEYLVTIIDVNGCQVSSSILLRVDKTKEIFIPNAFSPNHNGTNDVFMIFADGKKVRQINTFQVYDRWGEQVFLAQNFQPNDPAFGWDGALNGEFLNPAVFVYFAEIEFVDGEKRLYKGDVALMK